MSRPGASAIRPALGAGQSSLASSRVDGGLNMTELLATDASARSTNDAPWHRWRVAPDLRFRGAQSPRRGGAHPSRPEDVPCRVPFRFSDDGSHRDADGTASHVMARRTSRRKTPWRTLGPSRLRRRTPPILRRSRDTCAGSKAHTARTPWPRSSTTISSSDEANGGPLEDDTLSDRFFREMMKSAGVPWLKRWIMWSAVALRSRWAVGGIRRLSVLVWLILSAAGITSLVWAVGSATLGWDSPTDTWVTLTVALVLPFAAACPVGQAVPRRHRGRDRRAVDPARRRTCRRRLRHLPRSRTGRRLDRARLRRRHGPNRSGHDRLDDHALARSMRPSGSIAKRLFAGGENSDCRHKSRTREANSATSSHPRDGLSSREATSPSRSYRTGSP